MEKIIYFVAWVNGYPGLKRTSGNLNLVLASDMPNLVDSIPPWYDNKWFDY